MSERIVLFGVGRVGGALARRLAGREGLELLLVDRDGARASALAAELGARGAAGDVTRAADLPALLEGATAVVDATEFAGRDRSAPRAALAAGAHWVDLAADPDWVLGATELEAEAVERGLRVASGAGVFCGLTDPFVRQAAEPMVRVNEVLYGVLPGPKGRLGPASARAWLAPARSTVRMLIGGEWTEREFFGDARRFEHPAPYGPQRSFNLDAPDLRLFTERPIRSASVRLSVGFGNGLKNRVAEWCLRGGPAGGAARLGRWARLAGDPPGAVLTVLVRGIDANRMPIENRLSVADEGPEPRLEVAAAARLVTELAAGRLEPGAGPAVGLLSAPELERDLEAEGLRVRRGNLGGWRS